MPKARRRFRRRSASIPERANTFLHAMPAWVGGSPASLGMKWVSYFPGNFDRGLPDSTGIIILNDPEIGLPCCIMEGMYVTFLRTAACAAVAAKYLAPRPPKTLGLIGCGGLGLWSLRTLDGDFSDHRAGVRFVANPEVARDVLREDDAGGKMRRSRRLTIRAGSSRCGHRGYIVAARRRQAGIGRRPCAGYAAYSARSRELVAGQRTGLDRSA